MKNLLLVFGFLVAMHWAFGQAIPTASYRIANNTTSLGINISSGTQVFDMANKKLYVALRAVPSTITIEAGLADVSPYFEVVGGSSLSMKPTASSVGISGTIYVGSTVNGTYIYESDEAAGAPEGTSTFKWYQADDNTGTNKAAISGATTTSYLIGSLAGKWLAFGVTPVSTIPATGSEVLSSPWQYIYAGGVTASVSLTTESALYIGQELSPTPSFDPTSLGTCDQTANATYTWYRNSSASKTGATTIASGTGTSPTYTVLNTDENQYIGLEVIPDATCNAAITPGINWKQVIALTPVYANATISGLTSSKAKTGTPITAVKGTYSTTPTNLTDSEGTPTYQWYWATDGSGTGKTTIAGQTGSTHDVNKTLYGYTDGNYLAVGITPKTISGETGTEVLSSWVEVYTNSAPVASNVDFTGTLVNSYTVTASFTYTDADSDAAGTHSYVWQRADDASGTGAADISGATASTYLLTTEDGNKYVRVGVTPVALDGTSPGTQVFSSWKAISLWTCGNSITINHTYDDGVTPTPAMAGSRTYGTAAFSYNSVNYCVITQNLGASRGATSKTERPSDDPTVVVGWHWKQGESRANYIQGNKTVVYGVTWNIGTNAPWNDTTDPCTILLGSQWTAGSYDAWMGLYQAYGGAGYPNALGGTYMATVTYCLEASSGAFNSAPFYYVGRVVYAYPFNVPPGNSSQYYGAPMRCFKVQN